MRFRSTLLIAILALPLASCNWLEDPAITLCEARVKSNLKSPSSYKRIEAKIFSNIVSIDYDASNSYGAIIRGKNYCGFKLHENRFILEEDKTPEYDRCTNFKSGQELQNACGQLAGETLLLKMKLREDSGVDYPIDKSKTKLASE